ncbi:MAG: hypothetical protein QOC92_1001 [Acidimicrobiaceae bacterium]|jgi:pimeloyl-ACP methyl ester carboxylesterase
MIPAPSGTFELAGGRRLAYDDIGDPAGRPIVYLHGCPGSRLSRHPDDSVAAGAGLRLIAVDRPGYGSSNADPSSDPASCADDVIALADGLGLGRFAVLAWSSGGATALALAVRHPERVVAVGVAAGQPAMITDRGDLSADDFARMAAPFVAESGVTVETAMEATTEGVDAASLSDLASVEGLHEQLALSLATAVEHGLAGVEGDLRAMVTPWSFELASISTPVTLWYGTDDTVYGPSIGQHLADSIPNARLEILEGATHLLPMTNWSQLLDFLAQQLEMEEHSCR